MNCRRVLPRLNAYADGELSRLRASGVSRHLKECPSCRKRFEELRALEVLLEAADASPLPEGFSSRLLAEAARCAPKRRPERLGWLPRGLRVAVFGMSVPMRLAACGTAVLAFLVGASTAGWLVHPLGGQIATAETRELYGLEWFGSAPPLSLATYVADARQGDRR
jgi:anti-sigma factor RsiW